MIVKLLAEHHLAFLSLKGGCTGSSEYTHVKMQHCWKSHALAHIIMLVCHFLPLSSECCSSCCHTGCSVVIFMFVSEIVIKQNY